MGLRFSCPRRAVAAIEAGDADWIIVGAEAPAVIADIPIIPTARVRLLWNRAIHRVRTERRTYKILAKLFARLGVYLQDARNRHARIRPFIASSWSSVGRYLNCRKALYRINDGTQRR